MSKSLSEFAEEQGWDSSLLWKSQKCHLSSWNWFAENGEIPQDAGKWEWCLHHIDPTMKWFDPSRYCLWALEDVTPMQISAHVMLHRDFERRNREYSFLDELMALKMNAEVKANAHH